MKLLSYGLDYRMEPRLAFSQNGQAVDVMRASLWMKDDRNAQEFLNLASSMKLILEDWSKSFSLLTQLADVFQNIDASGLSIHGRPIALPEEDIVFFAPVPDPPSLRFFNTFTDDSPKTFDFGQTQTLRGHKQSINPADLSPRGEIAAIIAASKTFEDHEVAGFTIVNNWVASQEKAAGQAGFALGQATSLGPYLVTSDQVDLLSIGSGFNMDMQIRVDGRPEIDTRFKEMNFSFADMLASSKSTQLSAGDILCSGSPSKRDLVLNENQTIDIEVQGLGTLTSIMS